MVETARGTPQLRLINVGLKALKTFFNKKGDKSMQSFSDDVKNKIDEIYSQVYTAVVKNKDYKNFENLKNVSSRHVLSRIRDRSVEKGLLDPNIGNEAILMNQQKPAALKTKMPTYVERQGPDLQKKIKAYQTIVDEIIKEKGFVKKINPETKKLKIILQHLQENFLLQK